MLCRSIYRGVLSSHQIFVRGSVGAPQLPETCPCQLNVFKRMLSVSNVPCNKMRDKISANREVRMMKKMVSGAGRAKRKNFTFNQHASEHLKDFGFMTKGEAYGRPKGRIITNRVKLRIEMLNNLFVEQITSLLGTGEVAPQFLGLGIQFSKVKTKSDFSGVNVYWFTAGAENDEKIEKLLKNAAGHLRHVLTQLRVIGIVPPITFVKDNTVSMLQEVDFLLSKADLGDDFTSPSNLDDVGQEDDDEIGETSMRHDILGLRRDVIMNEIIKNVQKKQERILAKEKHIQMRSISDESELPSEGTDQSNVESHLEIVEDHRKRQFEFFKYLKQRKSEKEKERKRLSIAASEKEFYSSIREEKKITQLKQHLDEIMGKGDQEEDDDDDDDDYSDAYAEEDSYSYDNQREHFK